VRPYEKSRVALPSVGAVAPRLLDILDDVGEKTLRACEHSMLRSEAEWGRVCEESQPITPFMDSILKNDTDKYLDFIRTLWGAGMLDFSFEVKGVVLPFFVVKKGNKLRLVWDCRVVNRRFKAPPRMRIATGASVQHIPVASGKEVQAASLDISNFFDWMVTPEWIRQWFGLPPVPISFAASVTQLLPDLVEFARVHGLTMISPRLRVVAMGWNGLVCAEGFHSPGAVGFRPDGRSGADGRGAASSLGKGFGCDPSAVL